MVMVRYLVEDAVRIVSSLKSATMMRR